MILIYNPPQFPISTLGPKSRFQAGRVSEISGFRYGGHGQTGCTPAELDELELPRRKRSFRRGGPSLGQDYGDAA